MVQISALPLPTAGKDSPLCPMAGKKGKNSCPVTAQPQRDTQGPACHPDLTLGRGPNFCILFVSGALENPTKVTGRLPEMMHNGTRPMEPTVSGLLKPRVCARVAQGSMISSQSPLSSAPDLALP